MFFLNTVIRGNSNSPMVTCKGASHSLEGLLAIIDKTSPSLRKDNYEFLVIEEIKPGASLSNPNRHAHKVCSWHWKKWDGGCRKYVASEQPYWIKENVILTFPTASYRPDNWFLSEVKEEREKNLRIVK